MANNNLKKGMEMAQKYGITDVQFIQGTNPKQAIGIMYKGKRYSTSAFVGKDFENLFSTLACTKEVEVKSVAGQKVSTAWGKNALQTFFNQDTQSMTYADGIGSLIQVKGQELKRCLAQLVDITENSNSIDNENMNYYKTWVQHVINFYATDDEGNFNADKVSKAKRVVLDLINNKEVYIIREHIYTNYNLYEFIKNWYGENDIKASKEDIQNKVDEWVKLVA